MRLGIGLRMLRIMTSRQWMIWVMLIWFGFGVTAILQSQSLKGDQYISKIDTAVPVFDVVSIRQNISGQGRMSVSTHLASFEATNISLRLLIASAYGVREDLVLGLPDWTHDKFFDVKAKVSEPDLQALRSLTPEQRLAMIAQILTSRFALTVHNETKIAPMYELVVSKNMPGLHKSADISDMQPRAESDSNRPSRALIFRSGELTGSFVTMESLSKELSQRLHRSVIDKTGLLGEYTFDVTWLFDAPSGGSKTASTASFQDEADLSMLDAMDRQLGLKVKSTKGPIDTVVVDHVEQPTEN